MPQAGGLLAALVVGAVAACGSGGSSAGSATGPQTTSSDSRTSTGAGSAGPTTITVAGGPAGTLPGDGAACIPLGGTSFQVAITGTVAGTRYVLKFDAPGGTTDLTSPQLASDTTTSVFFGPATGGGSWAVTPASHHGSGTLTVDGTTGGRIALHLVPSTGSTVTTALDINGAYTCAAGSST
jgi:hypothetical protein